MISSSELPLRLEERYQVVCEGSRRRSVVTQRARTALRGPKCRNASSAAHQLSRLQLRNDSLRTPELVERLVADRADLERLVEAVLLDPFCGRLAVDRPVLARGRAVVVREPRLAAERVRRLGLEAR